jgi:hypothetical protein
LQAQFVVHAKHFSEHMNNVEEIKRRIVELDVEHRDLDAVIEMLTLDGHHDQLQLRRLKKRKLQLKDYITLLKMQLVPDVPA